jgi:hypothetical protein
MPELDSWLLQLTDQLQRLPPTSVFSGAPTAGSGVSADPGTLGIDVSATTTNRLWVKFDSGNTYWAPLAY